MAKQAMTESYNEQLATERRVTDKLVAALTSLLPTNAIRHGAAGYEADRAARAALAEVADIRKTSAPPNH